MGYACPVCEIPHQDEEHLANHLAFTALLHGDDHEVWLDNHVPEWGDLGPDDLARRAGALANEADYPVVFDDTTEDTLGHDTIRDPEIAKYAAARNEPLDPAAERILQRARELTDQMYDPPDDRGDEVDE